MALEWVWEEVRRLATFLPRRWLEPSATGLWTHQGSLLQARDRKQSLSSLRLSRKTDPEALIDFVFLSVQKSTFALTSRLDFQRTFYKIAWYYYKNKQTKKKKSPDTLPRFYHLNFSKSWTKCKQAHSRLSRGCCFQFSLAVLWTSDSRRPLRYKAHRNIKIDKTEFMISGSTSKDTCIINGLTYTRYWKLQKYSRLLFQKGFLLASI